MISCNSCNFQTSQTTVNINFRQNVPFNFFFPILLWRKWKVKVSVTQSCLTLCDPVDYSLSGSSVHGILQVMLNNYDFKRKNSFIKFIDFFRSFIHFSAQLCQTQLDANSIEKTYSLVYLLSNPELNKTRGNYRKINKQKKRKFKLLFQSFSTVCTLPLF